MTKKGLFFVVIQFSSIILLLYLAHFQLFHWALAFHLSALIIALWAAWEMKRSRLSVFPELKVGSVLIKTGPYQYVRHPMYVAVLLFFLPLCAQGYDIAFVFLVLVINLVMKMKYEEKLLKVKLKDYEQYTKQSSYLIPFIY